MHASGVKAKFGERLRALRLEAGLSQEQLAEAAQLDRTYISSTERGLRNISLEAMSSIAKALGKTPAAFFVDDNGLSKKHRKAL